MQEDELLKESKPELGLKPDRLEWAPLTVEVCLAADWMITGATAIAFVSDYLESQFFRIYAEFKSKRLSFRVKLFFTSGFPVVVGCDFPCAKNNEDDDDDGPRPMRFFTQLN